MDATETGEAASVAMGDGGIAQGRLIIVGDVHGCLHELRQLMGRIEPAVEDRIIFIGDLIDKGPDLVNIGNRQFTFLKRGIGQSVSLGL